jgi:hypothetical protein
MKTIAQIAQESQVHPPSHADISIRRQCELVGLARSSWYDQPAQESGLNLELMRLLDEQYLKTPFYGRRNMTEWLRRRGYQVNQKRVGRRISPTLPMPHGFMYLMVTMD